MLIQHFEKVTLLDFPGRVASVIFTYGCNLRCPYCHNPELVVEPLREDKLVTEDEVIKYLKKRKGKIDGLVITGGEPTVHKDLLDFITNVKSSAPWIEIKLDTNGTFPDKVKELVESGFIDYWAMDVKYEDEIYKQGFNGGMKVTDIRKSINIIKNSGVEYEFRTTVVKGLHNAKVMRGIGEMIKGSRIYYIQNFRAGKTIDPELNNSNSFSRSELNKFAEIMKLYVDKVIIRGD